MPDNVREALLDLAARRIEELTKKPAGPGAGQNPDDSKKLAASALASLQALVTTGEAVVETKKSHLQVDNLELLPHQLHLVGKRVDKPAVAVLAEEKAP